MVVSKIIITNHKIQVFIDNEIYLICEETFIKYRLYEGKELKDEEFKEIILSDELEKYQSKAINYALRYMKSEKEVILYLVKQGLSYEVAQNVVLEISKKKLIQDDKLAISIAASLAAAGNGPKLIEYKLKNRLFSEEVIALAINNLGDDLVVTGKNKLIAKLNKQYKNLDENKKQHKIKEGLYRHGYIDLSLS